jgi:hypothetical protein
MHLSLAFDPPPQPVDLPTRRDSPVCLIAKVVPAQDIHSPAAEAHCRDRYEQYQFGADDDEKLIHHVFIIFLAAVAGNAGSARRLFILLDIYRANQFFITFIFGQIKC